MSKARLLPLILLLAGCTDGNTRKVSGTLDSTQFSLEGAEVIGAAMSGRTHRAPIRSDGRFEIELQVGERYQLRFARPTAQEGVYDAFAVLRVDGGTRRTFQVMAGEPVELGRVGLIGTVQQSQGLRALTGGGHHDDDDDDGDTDGDRNKGGDDDGDTDGDDVDVDTDTDTDTDGDSTNDDDGDTDSDSDSDSDQDDDDVAEVCDVDHSGMQDVEAENDPADDMCACSHDNDDEGDSDADSDSDSDDDSDSDSDTDSDTDSDATGSDHNYGENCGSDRHDEQLDGMCENNPPVPEADTDGDGIPDGEDPDPNTPNNECTANEDCASGICDNGVCVNV